MTEQQQQKMLYLGLAFDIRKKQIHNLADGCEEK